MFKTLEWMGLLPLILVLVGTIGAFSFMMHVEVGGGGNSIEGEAFGGLVTFIGVIRGISIFTYLPVNILVGFIGRNEIVNGCMNCGFKWRPAKRK